MMNIGFTRRFMYWIKQGYVDEDVFPLMYKQECIEESNQKCVNKYVTKSQAIRRLFSADNYTHLRHKSVQYKKMRVMFVILRVSKHVTNSLRIIDVPACTTDSAPCSLILYLHTPAVHLSCLLAAD